MEKSLNVMKCVLVKETELKYTTKSSPCDTIANVLFEYGFKFKCRRKDGCSLLRCAYEYHRTA